MSIYNANLAGLCEDILTRMEDLQGENYSFRLGKINGALDFILSDANVANSGAEITGLSDASGKLKSARVVYKAQQAESFITDGTTAENASLCDTGEEPEPLEVTVQIDDAVGMAKPLYFSNNKMKEYCQDATSFMNEYLFELQRLGREKLDQKILSAINSGAGINYEEDGTTTAAGSSKSVDILSSTGVPLYQGFEQIIGDYENNNLNGMPALIGQGNWLKYYRLQNLVCCNDTSPFVGDQGDVMLFKDQHANSILGSNEALVVAPGATQLITYQENAHIDMDTPLVKHLVIPDQVYGNALPWDLDFRWSECKKRWEWFIRTYIKIFNTFQPDAFPSGSPLGDRNGMTGIFKYTGAQAA